MVEQLKVFKNNVLAIEAFGDFSETDEQYCQKLFNRKREQGFDQIHLLVKLDEAKIANTSFKVIKEDFLFALKNYKHMGRFAVVADSNILKALMPIDNLFYKNAKKGREERYFDISEIEEAFEFVGGEE